MRRAAPCCQLSAPAQCFLSSRTLAGGRNQGGARQAGRGPHQTRPQAMDSPHAWRPALVLACPVSRPISKHLLRDQLSGVCPRYRYRLPEPVQSVAPACTLLPLGSASGSRTRPRLPPFTSELPFLPTGAHLWRSWAKQEFSGYKCWHRPRAQRGRPVSCVASPSEHLCPVRSVLPRPLCPPWACPQGLRSTRCPF